MENAYQTPHEENVLDGMDVSLIQASSGKRFANFLVDRILLYVVWTFALNKLAIKLIVSFGLYYEDRVTLILWSWLFALAFDILFYAVLESLTNGKTPGKLITRTRAVNDDGSRISARTALLRSLSRAVPFEAFSALGAVSYPWHDRWTKTYVIDERSSALPA
jgi:uncharacterized RDD family membrane protein YckC